MEVSIVLAFVAITLLGMVYLSTQPPTCAS